MRISARPSSSSLLLASVTILVTAMLLLDGRGFAQTEPDQLSGCLTRRGSLMDVAIGDQPSPPCSPSETQVTWNVAGPPGPTGATGAVGEAGHQGAPGAPVVGQRCPSGASVIGFDAEGDIMCTGEVGPAAPAPAISRA
jgi:hypothetical protein